MNLRREEITTSAERIEHYDESATA